MSGNINYPDLPEPVIERRRFRLSLVWLIPLVAALAGISLVVQTLRQRGPSITVSFSTAEGIEPGKTKVKYKNVDIGDVKSAHLSEDRSHVIVTIELTKNAESFAVEGTRFWVVRPRFAGSGVSGLGTLLSGSYIGVDIGPSTKIRHDFTGLEEPPVVASDVPGCEFVLHADDLGSIDIGSPVYYRRIQVGHVVSFSLDPDGEKILLQVFIKAPYDRFVTANARFWHASGIDLKLDANGVKLSTQSLSTVLMGGIAFGNSGGLQEHVQAKPGSEFKLASDETAAMKAPDSAPETMIMRFNQSVRGLQVGAPLDFRGVEIGQVRSIDIVFDPQTQDFSSPVVVDLYPNRLGNGGAQMMRDSPVQRRKLISDLIRRGLRAQLRTGNLLTGQLYVALDFFPNAPSATLNLDHSPIEFPTVPGDLQELQQQVTALLHKLDQLPLETIGQDVHRALVSLNGALHRLDNLARDANGKLLPQIDATLVGVQRATDTAQETLSTDSPLQQDVRQALKGLTDASRSLKTLADTLERHPESLLQGKKDAQP